MSNVHHSINYIEFPITDMRRAQKFYGEAFGWKFTDYAPGYAGIQKAGGGEAGGLSLVEQVTPGGPLIVLYSDNLSESFEAVKKAGGDISKEIFEFPGGRRFEFTDLDGHHLAVWSE